MCLQEWTEVRCYEKGTSRSILLGGVDVYRSSDYDQTGNNTKKLRGQMKRLGAGVTFLEDVFIYSFISKDNLAFTYYLDCLSIPLQDISNLRHLYLDQILLTPIHMLFFFSLLLLPPCSLKPLHT